jgi:Tol biopolymer transport system component
MIWRDVMKITKKILIFFFVSSLGSLFLLSNVRSQQTAGELFEKALYVEEARGELQKAIDLYQEILQKFPQEREIAAKAQLHLGLCYEKLGLKQAQEAFQRVIDNYPEQSEAVKAAKEKLSIFLRAQALIERGDREFKITKIHTEKGREGYLSPDGKKLALIEYDKKSNLWLGWLRDIASGREVCLLSSPNEILDGFWSPDTKMIAYINIAFSVSVISVEGGQPKTIIEVDPEVLKAGDYVWPMGWTSDSKKLIFQDKAKGLFAIPASGGKWEEIFIFKDSKKAKEYNEWLTLSPDGKFIAYQSTQGNNEDIYVMPVKGGESVRVTDDPASDSWPSWSFDGRRLAFTSTKTGSSEIWVIRINSDGKPSGKPIQVTRGGGSGVWTQEGKIAYTTKKDIAHIFIANADGSEEIQLTKFNNWNVRPRWSPDAKNIALVTDYGEEGRRAVWTVPSKGGDEKFLTIGDSPVWSPEGKKIAFIVDTGRIGLPPVKAKISIIPAEGGEAKELMNYDGFLSNLDWSPDGRYIAFSYSRGKDVKNPIPDSRIDIEDIYLVSVDGGKPTRLTQMDKKGFRFTSPRWSPDGKKIAFRSLDYEGWAKGSEGEPISIYTIDVEGGEPKLVTNEMDSWWFCWSLDGKNIISSKHEKESKGPWVADHRLYKVSAEGGKPEKLNIMGMMPDFSPDGKKIAFSRSTEYSIEFWLVENFLPEEKK